jgi:hypothetical protein
MSREHAVPLEGRPEHEAEVVRLRKVVEAQAAALSNLALTAQLLAEQVEEVRRRSGGEKAVGPHSASC